MNKNKKNICLVYPGFPPEDDLGGGISVFCKMLVDAFISLDIFPTVISRTQKNIKSSENYRGVKIYRIPGDTRLTKFNIDGALNFSKQAKKMIAVLEHDLGSFDIIEAVDWGGEAIALLPEYSKKLVIRCHTPGFIAESYNPSNLPYLSEKAKSIEKDVLLNAVNITSYSTILMKRIEKEIGKKLNYNIQPAMAPSKGVKKKEVYKKRFDKSNPMKIICAGRIEERKGYHNLINALNTMTNKKYNITLDIFGNSTPLRSNKSSSEELGKLISDKNKGKITIKNKILHGKFISLYAKYDLCIVPSLFESWSLVGVEAIQSCLPTLISDTCELALHLPKSHNTLQFNATDQKSLVNNLQFAYKNYDCCVKIAKQDQVYINNKFDSTKIAEQVIKYYESITL